MINCPMPSDVLNYKPKMLGNFTTRQLLFGPLALAVGALTFFTVGKSLDSMNAKIIVTALPMIPFLLMGWMTLYGQPLEKIGMALFEDNFLAPAVRKKETPQENFPKFIDEKAPKKAKPAAKSRKYKEII
jgi:hypothetical protein